MKERSITIRYTLPWFTTKIITQKRMVRRREKIWCKYDKDHQWQALKIEHYNFVSNITGTTKTNPMPTVSSDEQFANEFAEIFIGKINKIRDYLDNHERTPPLTKYGTPAKGI